jgi:Uma2 family endonuclease
MPAVVFSHGEAVFELLKQSRDHLRAKGVRVRVSTGVDLIISEDDVLRVDGMLITDREEAAQKKVLIQLKRDSGRLGRIRVAPLLVIESVSAGHERHDRLTKSRLYANFGIPNYWLVDTLRRTLECFVLDGDHYRQDATGREAGVVRPSSFSGLEIQCHALWGD